MISPTSLSYYILSLGCAKNQVDSEKLNGAFLDAGFIPAAHPQHADIVVINTCAFIEDAKRESIDAIFEMLTLRRRVKRGFPQKVVVVGCLAKRYALSLRNEIPEIDFIYGLVDEQLLPALCNAFGIKKEKCSFRQVPLDEGIPYAYIKISEGCSNNCSFCAIPFIRGEAISFSPEKIFADVDEATARGVKELIIVAQDICSYRYGKVTLKSLVKKICARTDVPWIRLMYCHPDHVDEELIELIAAEKRICRYLDIPFQHASANVLRSMGRKGDAETYMRLIELLRKSINGIHIRSTFLVGYPNETEDDFRMLLDFIKEVKLEKVGAFMYSPEEGTKAFALNDLVPKRIKRARYHELLSTQKEISKNALRKMKGKRINVLVEKHIRKNQWIGRTEFDAPEVDGIFFLTSKSATLHSIVNAEVTNFSEYDLWGISE
ncbi:MAG: 30S ribosomal protein S12 methylthiotransferase RimO [Spirochaetes bacterium]|nr:30S ribosomal protein S12 methylthiotransferase RimO [Spirochaetota bacterium]